VVVRGASGYIMVALSAVLFAANGPVSIVLIDGGVNAPYVVSVRLAGMAGVMLAWALVSYRHLLRFTGREVLEMVAFGVVGLATMQWVYVEAIHRMPMGLVLMIEYMSPFLIATWSWLLWRQRQPRIVWVAIAVALVGLIFVLGVGGTAFSSLSTAGLLFSAASCLVFSYYATHASRLLRERPPQVVLGVGGLAALVVWSVTAAPIWRFPVSVLGAAVPLQGNLSGSAPGWLLVLSAATLGSAIPFALFLTGVARIGPTRGAVVLMLESVAAIVISWVWLDQRLGQGQILGALIVVGAILLMQVRRSEPATATG
jgi:drug/metabolite transporter (DMT)-like permease